MKEGAQILGQLMPGKSGRQAGRRAGGRAGGRAGRQPGKTGRQSGSRGSSGHWRQQARSRNITDQEAFMLIFEGHGGLDAGGDGQHRRDVGKAAALSRHTWAAAAW